MKVLLCERSFAGHRKVYMEWLARISNIEFYCLAPENIGMEKGIITNTMILVIQKN